MTIREIIAMLSRRIVLIAAMTIFGLIAGAVALKAAPVTYTASATAYVRVDVGSVSTESATQIYSQAANLVLQKTKAYQPLFTSKNVAESVTAKLGLNMSPAALAATLQTKVDPTSPIISVSATASTPALAQRIADEAVRQTGVQVRTLEGKNSPVRVLLMSSSALASPEKSPSPKKYLGAGILLGLFAGIALAYIREKMDRKIRRLEDVKKVVGERIIGALPYSRNASHWGEETGSADNNLVEESLRKIRTNLRYSRIDSELSSLLITSASQEDGKSTISKNLARVIAATGKQVVLIETDLRRPVFSELFNIPTGHPGLTHLLLGATSLEDVMWNTKIPGLSIIQAGDTPANPSELLGSARMSELVSYLTESFFVIMDAPPVLPVTDSIVLSRIADGVLIVVSAKKTTVDELTDVRDTIAAAGGSLLGVILNKLRMKKISGAGFGYGYSYGSGSKQKTKRARRK